jgi:glycosyltransferase involved in cell wall biosynthesis
MKRWPPLEAARGSGAQGPRVLLVADERDVGVRTQLRLTAPALAEAGYRLSFVAAGQEGLITALGERLRSRPYALVHVHGAWLASVAGLAGLLADLPPLLVSLREPPHDAGVRRWLLGRALALAAAVVTTCDDDRAAVLRLFPNLRRRQHRIITISEGVEAPLTPGPSPAQGRGEKVIGCAVAPDAGREALFEALARLGRFGGVGPFRAEASGGPTDELRQALDRRGLSRLVSVSAGPDFAAPCDLFVVPSRAGAQAAMQALCAGVPLLCGGGHGLREIAEDTPARVCAAGAASFEAALREGLSDPWTDAARQYATGACERFAVSRAGDRLVELYDRLTADVGARAA